MFGALGNLGNLGKNDPKDPYYQKAKEFTLCLEEITRNYDKQIAAMAASTTVGKQLAQSFATYRKVSAFNQPIFPIVEFLQKSTTWLTSSEELTSKFFTSLNDKTFQPTRDNVRSQTSSLRAIKAKKTSQNEKASGAQAARKVEDVAVKKTSEQCAFEIEEMTMSSLFSFWEAYYEYFEEGHKLMAKVKDGVMFMKKLSADAAKAKRVTTKKVFGVPLEELAEREAPAFLPLVLENMIGAIAKLADQEGIFRVSGSKSGMDQLRESIDSGTIPDFAAVLDPHTVPSLFKNFLRMLPTPLIPYENFEMVPNLNVPNVSSTVIVNHLKTLVQGLPPAHYYLLGRLLSLCQKIVAEKATTKMTASNIAVVIGPNIIRPPESSSPDSFGDSNTLVQLLVTHFDEIYPEKVSMFQDEEPTKATASMRKLRAHGVTIAKSTVNNLNWETTCALSNVEQPSKLSGYALLSRSGGARASQETSKNADSSKTTDLSNTEAPTATKDPQTGFRPSSRPNSRARAITDAPLTAAARASRSAAQGSFLGATRSNYPPALAPVSEAPAQAQALEPSPAPSVSIPASSSSSSPASTSPKYPIIGYHPKSSNPPSPTSAPPLSPKGDPPVPPARSSSPRSSSPPTSPTGSSSPTLIPTKSRSPTSSPTLTTSASASSIAIPNKKIIGKSSPPSKPGALSFSASSPNLPVFTPESMMGPVLAQKPTPVQVSATSATPAQPTSPTTNAQGSASASFRAARPTAQNAHADASVDTLKAEINKVISSIITGQVSVVRAKFAEVNSIPDGVPFIHVLKAVTPELDKLKKVMPTPPTFEKLPELPADQSKFDRLKFTIDFAMKDFTRALEHVTSFVAETNNTDVTVLQNMLQVIGELQRILAFNLNKL